MLFVSGIIVYDKGLVSKFILTPYF